MRTDNREDAFQLIPVGMRTENQKTQSVHKVARRDVAHKQARGDTQSHTHAHIHPHTGAVQTLKRKKKLSVLRWIYTRSCSRVQQSQQAQFDITEQLKLQMKNPCRDQTDIKHPKQVQQLQTFSSFPLSAWRLITRRHAVVSGFCLCGFRKSSEAFYIVRESWKRLSALVSPRCLATGITAEIRTRYTENMRGSAGPLQLSTFDTIVLSLSTGLSVNRGSVQTQYFKFNHIVLFSFLLLLRAEVVDYDCRGLRIERTSSCTGQQHCRLQVAFEFSCTQDQICSKPVPVFRPSTKCLAAILFAIVLPWQTILVFARIPFKPDHNERHDTLIFDFNRLLFFFLNTSIFSALRLQSNK